MNTNSKRALYVWIMSHSDYTMPMLSECVFASADDAKQDAAECISTESDMQVTWEYAEDERWNGVVSDGTRVVVQRLPQHYPH